MEKAYFNFFYHTSDTGSAPFGSLDFLAFKAAEEAEAPEAVEDMISFLITVKFGGKAEAAVTLSGEAAVIEYSNFPLTLKRDAATAAEEEEEDEVFPFCVGWKFESVTAVDVGGGKVVCGLCVGKAG